MQSVLYFSLVARKNLVVCIIKSSTEHTYEVVFAHLINKPVLSVCLFFVGVKTCFCECPQVWWSVASQLRTRLESSN